MVPKISVLIPVFNAAPYLRACLDSAIAQTLPEIEILCADDESTDGSLAILEEYARKDSRIRVFPRRHSGGGAVRNFLLSQAQGEYIYFLDSDDCISSELCEKTYRKAQETGADGIVIFWTYVDFPQEEPPFDSLSLHDRTDDLEKLKLILLMWATPWVTLWKRELISKNQLSFPENLPSHDNPFAVSAALRANQLSILPERLYFYHRREKSIQNSPSNLSKYWNTHLLTIQKVKEHTQDEECLRYAIRLFFVYFYLHRILPNMKQVRKFRRQLRRTTPKEFRKILSEVSLDYPLEMQEFYYYTFLSPFAFRKKIQFRLRKSPLNQKFRLFQRKIRNFFKREN